MSSCCTNSCVLKFNFPLLQELYRVTVGARPPLTANSSAADLARLAASSGAGQREASLPPLVSVSSSSVMPPNRHSSSENHVTAALQSALNHRAAIANSNQMYVNGLSSAASRSGAVLQQQMMNGAVHGSGVRGNVHSVSARSNSVQQQPPQQQQQQIPGRHG